jgi:hypothetical protein
MGPLYFIVGFRRTPLVSALTLCAGVEGVGLGVGLVLGGADVRPPLVAGDLPLALPVPVSAATTVR